jgi:hypothetical protein
MERKRGGRLDYGANRGAQRQGRRLGLQADVSELIDELAAHLKEPEINLGSALSFLNLLSAHVGLGKFTFQTFDDSDQKRRHLIRVLHGCLAENGEQLTILNNQGAGVFVTVNLTDGTGRTHKNVRQIRAIFLDLDGALLAPVLAFGLKPHIVIESSPGKWHAYWLVVDIALDQFTPLQKAIAARFGGDTKISDLPRVMRLPGFLHRKAAPFQTRIVQMDGREPYSADEVHNAFKPEVEKVPAIQRTTREGPRANAIPLATEPAAIRTHLRAGAHTGETIPEGERNNRLFEHATGFARRGFSRHAILKRLQTMNAERCKPPLPPEDLDVIASQATSYGSDGFTLLPNALLDSSEWRSLPSPARTIAIAAYRRFDGFNDGKIALIWCDFEDLAGLRHSGLFYGHVDRLLEAGILVCTRKATPTQQGKTPSLYGFGARFKPPAKANKTHYAESAENALLD